VPAAEARDRDGARDLRVELQAREHVDEAPRENPSAWMVIEQRPARGLVGNAVH
jgi:hypothetical protein